MIDKPLKIERLKRLTKTQTDKKKKLNKTQSDKQEKGQAKDQEDTKVRKRNQARRLNREERLSQEDRNRKSMKRILGLNKRARKEGGRNYKEGQGPNLERDKALRMGRN